jgi:SAM-dependent methyltransferase
MCHQSCLDFVFSHLSVDEIEGSAVLEVGSRDVNGSVRPFVERGGPTSYVGVDIEAGPGVDEICDASGLVDRFGRERFDLVLSTELLEHVRDWRQAVNQMKEVLRPGGTLVITTRSRGFGVHAYPHDYWRYEPDDMSRIFGDLRIESIERDPTRPGVFLKAQKPADFTAERLDDVALYSIIRQERALDITDAEARDFRPPFSLVGFLWGLLPEQIRTNGFRPVLRRLLRKS